LSRTYSILTTLLFIFLSLVILGGLVWGNTFYSSQSPVEKDFLVPWLAAQTFLQYGDPTAPDRITPYSEPATQRAQIIFYGRIAAEGEDPLILWLPFPADLFYIPLAIIPGYDLARGVWLTLSEIALVVAAFLTLKLTGWKPTRILLVLSLLFPLLWLFGVISLMASSAVPFILLAVITALLALQGGHDEIAGGLLVFPLLKFGIFGLFVVFMLWWALFHRRWRILAGLGMVFGILLLLSFLLLPDWIMPFVRGLYWHIKYTPGISFSTIMGSIWPVAGPRLGLVLTGMLLTLLVVEWRAVRRKGFRHLLWTACLMLAISPLLGLPIRLFDYSGLFLPALLFFAILGERWKGRTLGGPAGIVLGLSLPLSYVTLFWPGAALFLPALLIIGLYWMKWWAIRPLRPLFE
jgi:hypothetical protein